MELKITRLAFNDFIALQDDHNLPGRAENMKSMDIDDHESVLKKCGIKPNDLVVDIGAFVGDTAYVFAKYGCIVHAIEPFFDAYICLVYNTRGWPVSHWNAPTGNGEHVELVNEGIGGNLGMRRVKTVKPPNGIPTLKIDDLELEDVRFMKIDCEGREVTTLLGAEETIKRCRPILFVEMNKDALEAAGSSQDSLSETIIKLGYTLEMYGSPPRWDWICRPI